MVRAFFAVAMAYKIEELPISKSTSRPTNLRLACAAFHKYGDAPRAPRRPSRKARGGRIPGVFDRRATPRGGMHRRPNATVFMKGSTKIQLMFRTLAFSAAILLFCQCAVPGEERAVRRSVLLPVSAHRLADALGL